VKRLSAREQQLLAGLAQAGKPTELRAEDLIMGKHLESSGLVCFVGDTALAVITPKGRHALAGSEPNPGRL
jgi:hypothetical protein